MHPGEASRGSGGHFAVSAGCNPACDQASEGARSTSSRPCAASSSICRVVWSMSKRSCRRTSSLRRIEVAVGARGDDDVGGQRAETGGHRPDVQVVDRANLLLGADRGADLVDVEALRRRLHQHLERLLDQAPGGGENEGRDQQADDRVDDREPPARTKAPARRTPSEPSASARLCRRTPSRLRSSR